MLIPMKLINSSLMKQHICIIQKVLSFRDWYAPCSTPWEVHHPWKAWAHQRKYKIVAKSSLFFKPHALHSAHAAQHPHSEIRSGGQCSRVCNPGCMHRSSHSWCISGEALDWALVVLEGIFYLVWQKAVVNKPIPIAGFADIYQDGVPCVFSLA